MWFKYLLVQLINNKLHVFFLLLTLITVLYLYLTYEAASTLKTHLQPWNILPITKGTTAVCLTGSLRGFARSDVVDSILDNLFAKWDSKLTIFAFVGVEQDTIFTVGQVYVQLKRLGIVHSNIIMDEFV
jgi:hypothetical protein